MWICVCAPVNAAPKKSAKTAKSTQSSGGGGGGDGKRDEAEGGKQEASFPMVVDDTRFFNNQSHDRSGSALKISLADQHQYSRIFFTGSEGQLATTLLEELLPSDVVLDIGAEVGVFALTAARMGKLPSTLPLHV